MHDVRFCEGVLIDELARIIMKAGARVVLGKLHFTVYVTIL
jgi:hypothetical protein